MSQEMSSEQSSFQITSSSSGVRALPARASSRESRGSSQSSSPLPLVRKGAHLKQSPTSDKGPGTGSLVPFTNRSPHNRSPSRGPAIPAGASSSRDVPMEEGRQGTESHEGSGVRLYQQNISVGLDPREVMSQAREFESTVLGQAQAAS